MDLDVGVISVGPCCSSSSSSSVLSFVSFPSVSGDVESHGLKLARLELSDCVRLRDFAVVLIDGVRMVSAGVGDPYHVFKTCRNRRGNSKGLVLRVSSVVLSLSPFVVGK